MNFWSPSDYYAFRGTAGAPFLFKLKAPDNAIGGFGIVARFAKLPEWLAWECFGEGNGAPTFGLMKSRLDDLRSKDRLKGGGGPTQIGCIILSSAVFFPRDLWIPQPADWGRQNLRYARYDLSSGEGRRVWETCLRNTEALALAVEEEIFVREHQPRYGEPTLVAPRLGQGTFRVAVTDAYRRACAVTREHSLPVLEAAHIQPYSNEGLHEVRNGLLLRSDLHRLFDKGYVTVTRDHRLEVSARLKEEYSNGRTYYPLHGSVLSLPVRVDERPDPSLLSWHNEQVYRG